MAVLLALAKRLPFVIDRQREQHWAQNDLVGDRLPWLLNGKTLGLDRRRNHRVGDRAARVSVWDEGHRDRPRRRETDRTGRRE